MVFLVITYVVKSRIGHMQIVIVVVIVFLFVIDSKPDYDYDEDISKTYESFFDF